MEDLNAKDMEVDLEVSESQVGDVKAGQSVTYTVDAYPNQTFTGTITQVYPTPTTSSDVTQYEVVATVDNSSGDLKPGMTASAEIQTENLTHVITVPAIALHDVNGIEGVYVEGKKPAGSGFKFAGGTGNSSSGGSGTTNSSSGGTGGFGGFAHGNGTSGSGTGGGYGGFSRGGSTGGSSTGSSGSAGTGSSSGSQSGGFSFGGSKSGKSSSNPTVPAGTYFQPVQVGVMGTSTVQITSGLTAGQKILLTLPGETASALVQAESSGTTGRGFGGAFGGGGFTGGSVRTFGGGGRG